MGYLKKRILHWNILNIGAGEWGLKFFGPKYQEAHPYSKSGRINCLGYVPVGVFWRYTEIKQTRTTIWKSSRLPRRCDFCRVFPAYAMLSKVYKQKTCGDV